MVAYPADLGHDFVPADASCNEAKGSMLAAEVLLGRWPKRNRVLGSVIGEGCDRARMVHDLSASMQIAAWAYAQAATAGGRLWLPRNALVPITEQWRQALG